MSVPTLLSLAPEGCFKFLLWQSQLLKFVKCRLIRCLWLHKMLSLAPEGFFEPVGAPTAPIHVGRFPNPVVLEQSLFHFLKIDMNIFKLTIRVTKI